MNFQQTIAYIESLSPTLEKPSLDRIRAFMSEHEEVLQAFPSFHVAGTNGKGSTVAVLDSLLRAAGLKVGRFTGPHLLRWNERFHIDGVPISDELFAEYATKVRKLSEDFGLANSKLGPLTWFEFLTAIAFFYFADNRIEVAVFEVGLGGRFDATNVLKRVIASVITNIDLDHTHILGNSVEEIASEKAGIIKPGVPVVTGATAGALHVIAARAEEQHAELIVLTSSVNEQNEPVVLFDNKNRFSVTPVGTTISANLLSLAAARDRLVLNGAHQFINTALAVTALSLWDRWHMQFSTSSQSSEGQGDATVVQKNILDKGISTVYWPGRMQFLKGEQLILDGAHNAAGTRALRAALDELLPRAPRCYIVGCFQNKKAEEILRALLRADDRVFVSEAASKRATFSKESLRECASACGAITEEASSISSALKLARETKRAGEVIIATGSFATVREVVEALGWTSVEDGKSNSTKLTESVFIS